VVLRVSPFLATLSTMFIVQSFENVVTQGGSPTYLLPAANPPEFQVIGIGKALGLDVPVLIAAVVLFAGWLVLERFVLGRSITAVGVQTPVARIAGVPVRAVTASVYVLSSMLCALAGIVLAARLGSFVPLSGGYYLLDSIGAVFIGTTLQKESLPNVPGTLVGVLIFGVLANGLNLIGLSFYWQGFARGLVLLLVLGLSVVLAKRRRRPSRRVVAAA
jgi:ribose transport system permease protein